MVISAAASRGVNPTRDHPYELLQHQDAELRGHPASPGLLMAADISPSRGRPRPAGVPGQQNLPALPDPVQGWPAMTARATANGAKSSPAGTAHPGRGPWSTEVLEEDRPGQRHGDETRPLGAAGPRSVRMSVDRPVRPGPRRPRSPDARRPPRRRAPGGPGPPRRTGNAPRWRAASPFARNRSEQPHVPSILACCQCGRPRPFWTTPRTGGYPPRFMPGVMD